ncbi:MAG: CBS domain-containing protein, partial [Anaerolineales bacterium]
AYLLEQGDSLDIVSDYLNHPLSLVQQSIYDYLRAVAEPHQVHGHTVIIAAGDARGMDEELSTIAHKLRDLLDPDGLILLIKIRGGVQLIARSTSDRVNVAGIASHFGGGGHKRAAAAMIKKGNLDAVRRELLKILPQHVRPPLTVAQIMSYGPQVFSPGTSVENAARKMQRYGHEGYPVVESGKVIGLLTRRAVDRAISHRLNLPVRSLMEAGEVTVEPGDSIEHLQRVMTDTGWGQIPIVEHNTGQIIGIVTRTDLLKTISPEPSIPGHHNLAERLEKVLPAGHVRLLKNIAEVAHEKRLALYVVGGFVRDLLLKRPSLDFDLVVEGDAIALAKALSKKYGGRITTHKRFGTAKWFLGDPIDFITARTEFYTHPTALPTIERGNIKLDLHRRDFTINTLALRLDGLHYGELHDYWGGYNDLRQGLIRVLHSVSFVDDPTRMLRAVRFEQRFGFQIETRTLELLQAVIQPQAGSGQALLKRVSGTRIRHELDRILDEPRAAQILDRLDELGLLEAIHEEIPWDARTREGIADLVGVDPDPEWGLGPDWKGVPLSRGLAYTLWLIRTPPAGARRITRRLRAPRTLEVIILAACGLQGELKTLCDALPSEVVARLEGVPLLALYASYLASDAEQVRARIRTFVTRWQHVKPVTSGHDLRAANLPPGPIYREILTTLRAAWLDGKVHTPEEEKSLLEDLLRREESCRVK